MSDETVWCRTPRLLLRRPTAGDARAAFQIHGDVRTYAHDPAKAIATLGQAQALLTSWIEHWDQAGFGYAAVSSRERQGVIGFAGVKSQVIGDWSVLNLYYRFDPAEWGHGYATEAVDGIIRVLESQHASTPLVARVAKNNPRSIAVVERLGLARLDRSDPKDPMPHWLYSTTAQRPA